MKEQEEKIVPIERLDYFICAAKHRNFTQAAKECGVAQSAISQQIAALEKELECMLFRRTGRSVELTEQGEMFFEQAQKLQAEYCMAVSKARAAALKEKKCGLRIGVAQEIPAGRLVEIFTELREKYPEILFERCSMEQAPKALRQREYDLIVGCTAQDVEKDLACRILKERKLKCLIPRELFELEGQGETVKAEMQMEELFKSSKRIYLSRTAAKDICSCWNLSALQKEKLHAVDDAEMILPMSLLNRSAALMLDREFPREYADKLYICDVADIQLVWKEVLLWRKDDEKWTLTKES